MKVNKIKITTYGGNQKTMKLDKAMSQNLQMKTTLLEGKMLLAMEG